MSSRLPSFTSVEVVTAAELPAMQALDDGTPAQIAASVIASETVTEAAGPTGDITAAVVLLAELGAFEDTTAVVDVPLTAEGRTSAVRADTSSEARRTAGSLESSPEGEAAAGTHDPFALQNEGTATFDENNLADMTDMSLCGEGHTEGGTTSESCTCTLQESEPHFTPSLLPMVIRDLIQLTAHMSRLQLCPNLFSYRSSGQ